MTKLIKFDAAEHLNTPARQATYLAVALETNDMAFIRDSLGVVARAQGMSKLAATAHVNRVSLYKALGKTGNPGLGTVINLLDALGLTLSVHPMTKRERRLRSQDSRAVAP